MHRDGTQYTESLYAPLSWWFGVAGLSVVVWWVFVLATPMSVALAAAAVTALSAGGAIWHYGKAPVGVRGSTVYAGAARIDAAYCGTAVALDPQRTAALSGREADATAYRVLRPYVDTAVRIDVDDARDATPYWLVSSRRPDRLAAAVNAARDHDGTA